VCMCGCVHACVCWCVCTCVLMCVCWCVHMCTSLVLIVAVYTLAHSLSSSVRARSEITLPAVVVGYHFTECTLSCLSAHRTWPKSGCSNRIHALGSLWCDCMLCWVGYAILLLASRAYGRVGSLGTSERIHSPNFMPDKQMFYIYIGL
jgi:hypothetical protein